MTDNWYTHGERPNWPGVNRRCVAVLQDEMKVEGRIVWRSVDGCSMWRLIADDGRVFSFFDDVVKWRLL